MQTNASKLHERLAHVTGSFSGNGFALARGPGEAGALLLLNGRNGSRLRALMGAAQIVAVNIAALLLASALKMGADHVIKRSDNPQGLARFSKQTLSVFIASLLFPWVLPIAV